MPDTYYSETLKKRVTIPEDEMRYQVGEMPETHPLFGRPCDYGFEGYTCGKPSVYKAIMTGDHEWGTFCAEHAIELRKQEEERDVNA